MRVPKIAVIFLTVIIAIALCGVGYALWAQTLDIGGTVQTGDFNGGFTACPTNDPPGTIDPGKDKDVAWCTAELAEPENGGYEQVIVTIENAYPCYECEVNVTVQNHGTPPMRIARVDVFNPNPDELTVTHQGLKDVELDRGEWVVGTVKVHLEQPALQGHIYIFTIELHLELWRDQGGTIGFWGSWDRHKTYTEGQLNTWLGSIDANSDWLVPDIDGNGTIDVHDMEQVFDEASGPNWEEKFLGHYLATRLNVESGRLSGTRHHDVSGLDPGNYLGLSDPTSASAEEIISAMENKYGTSPSDDQFEIMKDICDGLNNLSI